MKDLQKITVDGLLEAKMNGTPPLQIIHQLCIDGEGDKVAQNVGVFFDAGEAPVEVLRQMCQDGCVDNAIEHADIFIAQGMTPIAFVDTICTQDGCVATLIHHYDEIFALTGINVYVFITLLCHYDCETVQHYRDYLIEKKEVKRSILDVQINHVLLSRQT